MRRLNLAQVGGAGGFFGPVHMDSAALARRFVVTKASALHPDSDISVSTGEEWHIPFPCKSVQELIERKKELELDGAMIAVPNDMHFPIACDLALAGFHGFLEKPITATVEESRDLVQIIKQSGTVWAVNFTYAGNATWRKAKEIISGGGIGTVRYVRLLYWQGWLWQALNVWREKKGTSGFFGGLADIGSHCLFSTMFLLGQNIKSVQCKYQINVPGRELDDTTVPHLI